MKPTQKQTPPSVLVPALQTSFPEKDTSQFYNMHQGTATSLIYESINSPVTTDYLTGEGVVENKGRKLILKGYNELIGNIGSTDKQLFIALIVEISKSQKNSVYLPLEKYMDMRGIKDKKTARAQVKTDLKTLASIRIEFREKLHGKEGNYLDMNLSGGTTGIVNGVIIFNFNTDFLDYLRRQGAPPIPKGILELNLNKNPNSSYFMLRINSHKLMNRKKRNEDIIRVITLLECTPKIPKYEDIKDQGRINQRIIEPFERDMDAQKETLKWHYCGTNGTQIDPPINYEEFSKALVKITWVHPFPEMKELPKKTKNKKTKKP